MGGLTSLKNGAPCGIMPRLELRGTPHGGRLGLHPGLSLFSHQLNGIERAGCVGAPSFALLGDSRKPSARVVLVFHYGKARLATCAHLSV
jgi:hypothetical protein